MFMHSLLECYTSTTRNCVLIRRVRRAFFNILVTQLILQSQRLFHFHFLCIHYFTQCFLRYSHCVRCLEYSS